MTQANNNDDTLRVVANELPDLLMTLIRAGIVPYIQSSPGIGKSQISHQIAKNNNLKVIDMRLAGCDPTDLNGFPQIVDGRAGYKPFEEFPIQGDELPWKNKEEGTKYNGWLLLLDELSSAPKAVQAASYKLILDRMTGQNKLHNNVVMIACGNLMTDGAIVSPLSSALVSRVCSLQLEFDYDSLLEYAVASKWDYRIVGYLRHAPDSAYTFQKTPGELNYACPRTWEFIHRIIKNMKTIDPMYQPLLTGQIGQGVGLEFYSFTKIFANLPTIKMLVADPLGIEIDWDDMAKMHALAALIEANLDASNAKELIQVVERMPAEFQVICIQNLAQRDPNVASLPPVINWMTANCDDFITLDDD